MPRRACSDTAIRGADPAGQGDEEVSPAGNLDEALGLAEALRPGDDTQPPAARFVGACVRGKVSAIDPVRHSARR